MARVSAATPRFVGICHIARHLHDGISMHVAGVWAAAARVRLLPGVRAVGVELVRPHRHRLPRRGTWGHAATADFAPIRRMCRLVMANYETDLAAPLLDPSNVVRHRTYADTGGLNLGRESDYALLLDNRLGKCRFEGGYVHNGLLRAAGWVLDKECDLLRDLLDRYPDYTGHSLIVIEIGCEVLTEYVVQDLNLNPKLPFDDNTFDVITNVVSVDYLTKPMDVFKEMRRILEPSGLAIMR
ncbi:hypothetical protein ZWY2020_012715 [Hordeum vulgare]|nr:hypothetical protein ZWY2020_012715 [Hordeum vulgare]